MDPQPLISVIVPVYRVEEFLRKCVLSVAGQTYRNLEIWLVDDGSPDRCGLICDEMAQDDPRIRVIHKANGGLSSARNAALDVARGEYYMFVDSDDWVEPCFCEKALEMVQREGVRLASFGFWVAEQGKDGEVRRKSARVATEEKHMTGSEAIRSLLRYEDAIYNYSMNKIYHRNLFEGVRYPEGRIFEDNAVTYLLLHRAGEIYVSREILYNYLRRKGSITSVAYSPQELADKFEIWHERLGVMREISPENAELQMKQLAKIAVRSLVSIPRKGPFGYVIPKIHRFLEENKAELLACVPLPQLWLYYHARPLLPLLKPVFMAKDALARLREKD